MVYLDCVVTALKSTDFLLELCNSQSLFVETVEMNEKCHLLDITCHKTACEKKHVTSLLKLHFFSRANS